MKEESNMLSVTSTQVDEAIYRLLKHKQNTTKLKQVIPRISYNVTYYNNLNSMRFPNSVFNKCVFHKNQINNSASSGTQFSDVTLKMTEINDSNLQYCTYYKSVFDDCRSRGTSFDNCLFSKTSLLDCFFRGNTFSRTVFDNCILDSCDIKSCSFESAVFSNSTMKNMRLSNLSLEYAEFENISMDKVILPFSQLPYIFNGLDYIINTKDDISISSLINKERAISVEEYIGTLRDWEIYFISQNDFFPLANIYFAKQDRDLAMQALLCGIVHMIEQRNFKMLKYLCKLTINKSCFSTADQKELYNRIETKINEEKLNFAEQYNLDLHLPDIKDILITNPRNQSELIFTFQTNIPCDDYNKVAFFISQIERLLSFDSDFICNNKSIKLQHHSPYEIIVFIHDNLETINYYANLLECGLVTTGGTIFSLLKMRKELILNKYLTKNEETKLESKILQNEQLRLQNKKIELEIEQIRCELKATDIQIKSYRKEIKRNNRKKI